MPLDMANGRQKKNALLEFRFSSHCYSRLPKEGEEIPDGTMIRDGSTHKPRDRVFCLDRYNLSLQLVGRLDTLIASNGEVMRSRHLNFFSTHLVTVDAHGGLSSVPYYIFMMPTKKQPENREPRIELFVESAYPATDPNIPPPVGKGSAQSLSVMLGGVWETGSL